MLGYKRLAKEDYEYFGSQPVWRLEDIVFVLTSFELEESGEYGDSRELYKFKIIAKANNTIKYEHDGIDGLYLLIIEKWNYYITNAIHNKRLRYSNVGITDELIHAVITEDFIDSTHIEYGSCSLLAREVLNFLNNDIKNDAIKLDINKLLGYFKGDSIAPSRLSIKVVEVPEKDYFRNKAIKRHAEDKPKHDALIKFLETDLSGKCNCTKRQACDRIFQEKYRGDETLLKSETGYGLLMFERTVSKVIKKIEEDKPEADRRPRHDNTKGTKTKNRLACPDHGKK